MRCLNRTYIVRKSLDVDATKIIFAVSGILILIAGLIAASVASSEIKEVSHKFDTIYHSMD